jgi:F-type H+-transporting ATPase subunit delta
MKLSKEARKGARLLFNAACPNGKLDEAKIRQVLVNIQERRPPQSGQILHEFHRLVRLSIERSTATVETSVALSADQQSEVQTSLRQRFGSELTAVFSLNPELIAGTRVRVGSDIYDSNVRERLARLRHGLSH